MTFDFEAFKFFAAASTKAISYPLHAFVNSFPYLDVFPKLLESAFEGRP